MGKLLMFCQTAVKALFACGKCSETTIE